MAFKEAKGTGCLTGDGLACTICTFATGSGFSIWQVVLDMEMLNRVGREKYKYLTIETGTASRVSLRY